MLPGGRREKYPDMDQQGPDTSPALLTTVLSDRAGALPTKGQDKSQMKVGMGGPVPVARGSRIGRSDGQAGRGIESRFTAGSTLGIPH